MIKKITLLTITLLTFSVFAINNKTAVNENEMPVNGQTVLVKSEPIQSGEFTLLKKAQLKQVGLFQVAVSCSQCSADLQVCLTMYPRPQCRQDFVDCRELCN
jgi:hypothetical protein